jgi:hypothetical protein
MKNITRLLLAASLIAFSGVANAQTTVYGGVDIRASFKIHAPSYDIAPTTAQVFFSSANPQVVVFRVYVYYMWRDAAGNWKSKDAVEYAQRQYVAEPGPEQFVLIALPFGATILNFNVTGLSIVTTKTVAGQLQEGVSY